MPLRPFCMALLPVWLVTMVICSLPQLIGTAWDTSWLSYIIWLLSLTVLPFVAGFRTRRYGGGSGSCTLAGPAISLAIFASASIDFLLQSAPISVYVYFLGVIIFVALLPQTFCGWFGGFVALKGERANT